MGKRMGNKHEACAHEIAYAIREWADLIIARRYADARTVAWDDVMVFSAALLHDTVFTQMYENKARAQQLEVEQKRMCAWLEVVTEYGLIGYTMEAKKAA